MPRESRQELKRRTMLILRRLKREYPQPKTALRFERPLELLVATILSAQCTDERVNQVTPGLFRKYPSAEAFASAEQSELEQDIRSTGFYRNKARSIIACSKALVERHGGTVPSSMEELTALAGVGRKTANCVLGGAFGINAGVVVDTHVQRLAGRLGLSTHSDPVKIESDLMQLVPQDDWYDLSNMLIAHGRRVCEARKPRCPDCSLARWCPSMEKYMRTFWRT